MSSGKAKRMLVHVKKGEEWSTKEFLSISDAIRYLRVNGIHFTDEDAFFQTDNFGTIIDEDSLIEIEEACEQNESLNLFGNVYIPLSIWCRTNGIEYESGKKMAQKKRLDLIKVGRGGRVYVNSNEGNISYKDNAIAMNGAKYIPLSCWAKRNGIEYHKAVYLYSKGVVDTFCVNNGKRKRIYVNEMEVLNGKK